MCFYGIGIYLPLFMQGVLGASAARSAIVFTQYALFLIAGNIVCGQFVSRTGQYRLFALIGSGLASAGLLLFSGMNAGSTQLEILRNVALCGLGFGALTLTYDVLVQNAASREHVGVATGSTQFFIAIGGTIGLVIFGTILTRIYHMHVDGLIPPGTPDALAHAFDNPLRLVLNRPNLEQPFSQIPNGHAVLASLLEGAHAGLSSAVQAIFLVSAAMAAVPFLLTLFLPGKANAR